MGYDTPPPRDDHEPAVRLLPHSLEAEEAVLGAMLSARSSIPDVAAVLAGRDFYRPAHGHVYDAVIGLYNRGEPADPITVADELRRRDLLDIVGGSPALVQLLAGTVTTSNVAHYARIVAELSLLRDAIGWAGEVTAQGYAMPEDVIGTIDRAVAGIQRIATLGHSIIEGPPPLLSDGADAWIDDLEARAENRAARGLRTGLFGLDALLGGGLKAKKLYVVAARPGVGKSALVAQIAGRTAHNGIPVHYASLEMTADEVRERAVSQMAVPAIHVQAPSARTDWHRVLAARRTLGSWPMTIRDDVHQTAARIAADARAIPGIGLVVVDYLTLLQLPVDRSTTKSAAIGIVCKELRALARELEIPVVVAAQLNRDTTREDRPPTLADLRDSGEIEQDADTVIMIHQPAAKGPRLSTAQLIVPKNRAGAKGQVRVAWVPSRTMFGNVARPEAVPHEPAPTQTALSMEPF